MLRPILYLGSIFILLSTLIGCGAYKKDVKIGVSLGVGAATRWVQEKGFMEKRAEELGAEIEVRLNTSDQPKTQKEDCYELIDSGIDVLILTPRDVRDVKEILGYAKEKKVKVINYARVALGEEVDLFIGFDTERIGQKIGKYLSELVFEGNYIFLRGDPGDNNTGLLYKGAMEYISPILDDINIILDGEVLQWSEAEAKRMVIEAVRRNGNKVDAIFAPNDKIAGACAEAVKELNLPHHVVITGTDAELEAVKRIVAGTQELTVYLDLKELADLVVEEACHMAAKEKVNVNTKYDNETKSGVDANLIPGKLVTKQNLDKILIESGHFTKREVYGIEKNG